MALLVAAQLDNTLEDAIAETLKDLTSSEHDELFSPMQNAPLAAFAAKIRLAYAMSIYGKITRDDLLVISRIRNVFAHSSVAVDFGHETIASACRSLKAANEYITLGAGGFRNMTKPIRTDIMPRQVFLVTCFSIASALAWYAGRVLDRRASDLSQLMAGLEALTTALKTGFNIDTAVATLRDLLVKQSRDTLP